MDSRVRRLLASDTLDEVTLQIRRLLPLLGREGISINYNQLLWDLRKWNKDSDGVKTGWGRGYWMDRKKNAESE
jgi:CRISPR type I-E-associated protein CasB/Cse2